MMKSVSRANVETGVALDGNRAMPVMARMPPVTQRIPVGAGIRADRTPEL
jgi:hypothetical protein